MHKGIFAAIFISIALIGLATFQRVKPSGNASPQLSVINTKKESEEAYQDLLKTYLEEGSSTAEDLTGTDLIGRQLVLDYLSLAQSGQATDASLTTLAERYVENLPTLITSEHVQYLNLNIVSNNESAFRQYADILQSIYKSYTGIIREANSKDAETDFSGVIDTSIKLSQAYKGAAEQMKNMPVPGELAEAHLNLTNLYLENASALASLGRQVEDPASSFAGLLVMKENVDEEQIILRKIEDILSDNGI